MKNVELKPELIFELFGEICKIPRPSKQEKKMGEYLVAFGRKHGIETLIDENGNVLMKKAATPGYENRKTVMLQCHQDMVCEKCSDVQHDFLKDAIDYYVDGEWMRARGTTLGADDGIGIAIALAAMIDDEVKHGPLQCLFTIDEETGLTGADTVKPEFLAGDILLNMDSEDEGEVFIGCAGGIQTYVTFNHFWVPVPQGYFTFRIDTHKFVGGHSGDDINKGHANANKILNRILCRLNDRFDLYLCRIDGGNLHNAIPRDAYAVCAVPERDKENVRIEMNLFEAEIRSEFSVTEPNFACTLQSETACPNAIDRDTVRRLLLAVRAVDNGVYAMSQEVAGLVETSSNLASIKMTNKDEIKIVSSQRSSIISSRNDMAQTFAAAFELAGAKVEISGGYPGWKPNVHSPILEIAVDVYRELFGVELKVKAIHAGLECGLFSEKAPHLDMISFGPTLRGVHSPDERLEIATVDKCWRFLLAVLERIPEK